MWIYDDAMFVWFLAILVEHVPHLESLVYNYIDSFWMCLVIFGLYSIMHFTCVGPVGPDFIESIYGRHSIEKTWPHNSIHPLVEVARFSCFERITCSRILGGSVRCCVLLVFWN